MAAVPASEVRKKVWGEWEGDEREGETMINETEMFAREWQLDPNKVQSSRTHSLNLQGVEILCTDRIFLIGKD